jgi:hypothetical protein
MPIPHTGKSRAAHASDDRGLAATHRAGAFRACAFFWGGDFPVEHEAMLLNSAAPATCDWIKPEASLGETMEIDTEAVEEMVLALLCLNLCERNRAWKSFD